MVGGNVSPKKIYASNFLYQSKRAVKTIAEFSDQNVRRKYFERSDERLFLETNHVTQSVTWLILR